MVGRMHGTELTFSSPMSGLQLCSQVRISKPISESGKVVVKRCAVRALWDTGAVISGVSRRVASKLGLKAKERARLATVAGESPAVKDIVLLDLFINNMVIPVKVVIVDSVPGTDNDFLIGMDVIQCGALSVRSDHDGHLFNVEFSPYSDIFKPISEILPMIESALIIDI